MTLGRRPVSTASRIPSMANPFFERPILNSPYESPQRHWELDKQGQPTQKIIEARRPAEFITPIPKPKKRKPGETVQKDLRLDEETGLSTEHQRFDSAPLINAVRREVGLWRELPEARWNVTPETARLLKHWRSFDFSGVRPFFCQIEAVETAIWLTEAAPNVAQGKKLLDELARANQDANPELFRIALKLATGAGKTTVMAMLIAWQTVNAVRHPGSKRFTRGFLVVAPGLTIKDRLRVLQPNDPDSYYQGRQLVPEDMLPELNKARIVITNYHAFKLRERLELSAGGRALLEGRRGEPLQTLETEGQMLQRVMPELLALKNVLVLNDEAHHCYREKPGDADEDELKGDEKKEAEKNSKAARLWISGLEALQRKVGVARVFDLSATPFFLRGSGYPEGTLFPWTAADFSLMDAIECGIVKLPRVPVAENIPGDEMPVYRNLWENIRGEMPKKGRAKGGELDPLKLPDKLKTAIDALYGHYDKTFNLWREHAMKVPPCFIIVCQNTAISKLVYDYVSGFPRKHADGASTPHLGHCPLFRNFDDDGTPLARPNTLLIDSEQLEAGDALDDNFRAIAADEIERFRREIVERSGNPRDAENITDQELLREVMNTVGKPGKLGEAIRCVVSVSMLTEGWDANTVTHILGVRAFGTQLLCEQVIGRALRRQSYDLNEEGLFNVEYADIFGIPFDFNAKPVVVKPQEPRETVAVFAVRPDRDDLEIRFPRVEGYRVELPSERLSAVFNADSVLELTPEIFGPTVTHNSGIIGEGVNLDLKHLEGTRPATVAYKLTQRLLERHWSEPGKELGVHLFGQLKNIAQEWLETCLVCKGGTYPAQLIGSNQLETACNRITAAISRKFIGENPVKVLLDPYNPAGSTRNVKFNTTKLHRWETRPDRCHLNWVILDSDWEAEFCRVAEAHPSVLAYVKNHNLGFEVPYLSGPDQRKYRPDFLVLVDDGHGADDPLHLVVEIKGYRGEDAKEKKSTMDTYWIPGVNNLSSHGRWAFAEFTEIYDIESDFQAKIDEAFAQLIASSIASAPSRPVENAS
jgi:type III restriction enzyme